MKKINFTKRVLDSLPLPQSGKRFYVYDVKVRGLALSVTARGTKTFLVYRWIKGRPERIVLGKYPDLSIELARGKASEINALIAHGENPNDQRRSFRNEFTLGLLFEEYLERHAKIYKKSWQQDRRQFCRYLAPWENRKLSTLTPRELQVLHQKVGTQHGPYADNRLIALLHAIFEKARQWGWWDSANPARGIRKYRERTRERFLRADELPRFFKRSEMSRMKPFAIFFCSHCSQVLDVPMCRPCVLRTSILWQAYGRFPKPKQIRLLQFSSQKKPFRFFADAERWSTALGSSLARA